HPAARGGAGEVVRFDAMRLRVDLHDDDLATDRELAPRLYARGDYETAELVALHWIAYAPDDPEAWNTAGGARPKPGQTEEGLEALRAAVARAPGAGKYAYNLGLAELKAGRFEEAAATLAPLVQPGAGDPATAPYAEALVGAGRRAEARALLVALLEKHP